MEKQNKEIQCLPSELNFNVTNPCPDIPVLSHSDSKMLKISEEPNFKDKAPTRINIKRALVSKISKHRRNPTSVLQSNLSQQVKEVKKPRIRSYTIKLIKSTNKTSSHINEHSESVPHVKSKSQAFFEQILTKKFFCRKYEKHQPLQPKTYALPAEFDTSVTKLPTTDISAHKTRCRRTFKKSSYRKSTSWTWKGANGILPKKKK